MLRHCPAIVRDQNATLELRDSQDLRIIEAAQARLISSLKVNRRLATPQRPHDVLIEIGIRLKSNFHRCKSACGLLQQKPVSILLVAQLNRASNKPPYLRIDTMKVTDSFQSTNHANVRGLSDNQKRISHHPL